MIAMTKTFYIQEPVTKVFSAMTTNKNYCWRSDLKRIDEIERGKTFIEYSKRNVPTLFNIIKLAPNKEYCFTMDNNNLHGKWYATFCEKEQGTELTVTKYIELKRKWIRPFARYYLVKQQNTYLKDLINMLKNQSSTMN